MAKTDSLRGTLDLLVLKVLLRGRPLTGYAINQALVMETKQKLRVRNSSLYPALKKMRKAGWISARRADDRRRSMLWKITKKGTSQFGRMKVDWLAFRSAVDLFLRRR